MTPLVINLKDEEIMLKERSEIAVGRLVTMLTFPFLLCHLGWHFTGPDIYIYVGSHVKRWPNLCLRDDFLKYLLNF